VRRFPGGVGAGRAGSEGTGICRGGGGGPAAGGKAAFLRSEGAAGIPRVPQRAAATMGDDGGTDAGGAGVLGRLRGSQGPVKRAKTHTRPGKVSGRLRG